MGWKDAPVIGAPGGLSPRGGTFIPKQPDPYKDAAEERARAAAERADRAEGRAERAEQRADAAQDKPSPGYRWNADHSAWEAIPGGPGDTARGGKNMREDDAKALEEQVTLFGNMKGALGGFQDDYAGNTITGRAENWLQALNGGIGTPGQRDWWSNFDAIDMQIRNKMFGASLTDSEKRSYEQTTVTPGMDPAIVRQNISRRFSIIQKALQRKVSRLHTAYNKQEVEATLGEYAPDLLPPPPGQKRTENVPPPGSPQAQQQQMAASPPPSLKLSDYDTGSGSDRIRSGESEVATGNVTEGLRADLSAETDRLIKMGRPTKEIVAYLQQNNAEVSPALIKSINDAKEYQHNNRAYKGGFAQIMQSRPTTLMERVSAGPIGGYLGGAGSAVTAGFDDEIAGGIAAAKGGDYEQSRDAFNAGKKLLAAENPNANLTGQVTGGVLAALGGQGLAGAVAPEALTAINLSRAGRFTPLAGDAAYGAAYGAGENNDNRAGGALLGGLTGGGAGIAGRRIMGGMANIIDPPAGPMGPVYERGVFPSIGQRFARSGLPGRAINTAEQALQSFPGLGAMIYRSRNIPRQQFQTAGWNDALGDIGQALPENMVGSEAMDTTIQAFDDAYNAARGGMQFRADPDFGVDLGNFQRGLNDGTLNAAQQDQVNQAIRTALEGRIVGDAMDGPNYRQAATDLSSVARRLGRNPDTANVAESIRNFTTILDNAARRNSSPEAAAALDAADQGYAKLVRLEGAAARGGVVGKQAGEFTPTDLLSEVKLQGGGVRSRAYGRGDALMQDFAESGRNLIDTLPNSGSGERLMTGQAVAGAGGAQLGLGGAIMAHPGALAPFAAYVPGIDEVFKRVIAPRRYTLPPAAAQVFEQLGGGIRDRRAIAGRLAVPAALGWELGQ